MRTEVVYYIKTGTADAPYELWSKVHTDFGGWAHNFVCEGSYEHCKTIKDRLEF